jgi:hypothetical protein
MALLRAALTRLSVFLFPIRRDAKPRRADSDPVAGGRVGEAEEKRPRRGIPGLRRRRQGNAVQRDGRGRGGQGDADGGLGAIGALGVEAELAASGAPGAQHLAGGGEHLRRAGAGAVEVEQQIAATRSQHDLGPDRETGIEEIEEVTAQDVGRAGQRLVERSGDHVGAAPHDDVIGLSIRQSRGPAGVPDERSHRLAAVRTVAQRGGAGGRVDQRALPNATGAVRG